VTSALRCVVRHAGPLLAAACLVAVTTACAHKPAAPVAGSVDADKFLHDKGQDALKRKKWLEAREYFRRLIDTFPRSQYRTDAKLGIGDSYLGEGRADSLVLAVGEFREFLTLAPLSDRADYAQYRLALAQTKQMLKPQRDQAATRDALRELDRFRQAYPTSKYKKDVDILYRQARDRLSDSELQTGIFHFKNRMYAGALGRFRPLMEADPGYTRRDQLIFYLAETLDRVLVPAEAKALYEQLVKEYPKSKFVKKAQQRLAGKGTAKPKAPPIKR
jgi:outer membrane protein assembly factor BamD